MEITSRKGIGGPKTEEGKARVSLNALKHGLNATSRRALEKLEKSMGCSYEETLERMRDYLQPADPLEEVLVRRIARSAWRTMLTELAENRTLAKGPAYLRLGRSYQNVIRSERFIDIHLHRAIIALQRKRDRECDRSQNKLNPLPIHERILP